MYEFVAENYIEDVEDANCATTDPEAFFPQPGSGNYEYSAEQLFDICARCPIKRNCLEYAVEFEHDWGIWAGTTPSQRRRMYRTKKGMQRVLSQLEKRGRELDDQDWGDWVALKPKRA